MKCFIRECEEMTNSRCFQRPIVDWSVLLCSASRMWLCLEICSPQDTSWSRQVSLRPWHLAAGYSHLHAFHLPKVHYTRIFYEGWERTTCCSSGLLRILAIFCLSWLKLGSGFHCSGCRRGLQNSCRYLICYLIWCRASRYNLFVRLLVHLLRVVVIRGKLKLSFFSLSAPYGNWKSVLIDCFQRSEDKIVILTRPSLSKWWQDVHLICTVLGWPC